MPMLSVPSNVAAKSLVTVVAASTLLLSGCKKELDMTIVHINDHHSHLEADNADLMLDGKKTRVKMGGFSRVVQKIDTLKASSINPVTIHAGDAVTGTLYYTLFKGEADAAMMNEVCFDVFALGNHEFDDGDAGLKRFLDFLKSDTCKTPVLAANVVPEVGVSPLAKQSATDYIQPYFIKTINDQDVGFIGLDIAKKTKNSSNPDKTTEFLDEVTTAQNYIDLLEQKGVDKIVLVTHYQYQNDLKLAQQLRGVDVIVGGDSHTLLGDFKRVGLNSQGDYPSITKDLKGNTVCVVQAWQYSAVVGELNISFDRDGNVTECKGTPHLLLGDSFKRKNAQGKRVELEGSDRQAVVSEISAASNMSVVEEDIDAKTVLARFSGQVDALKNEEIGVSTDDLCLERIPGQGKSKLCDVSATAQQGADISNIVAQAFLEMAVEAQIAIQNAGGVRIDVPKGRLTIGTAYTLLPFQNTLVELDMTGSEIKATLEDAIDYAIAEGGSTGAYPYAAGLRFNVDLSQAKGNRVSNVETKVKGTNEWVALNTNTLFKVVTNSFIAGGRDGYITMGTIASERRLDTYLDYAQSFVDYVKRKQTISKLPASEYSTQVFKGK